MSSGHKQDAVIITQWKCLAMSTETQRPKSKVLACVCHCERVWKSALRCDGGGKETLTIGLGHVAHQSITGFNWVIYHSDNMYVFFVLAGPEETLFQTWFFFLHTQLLRWGCLGQQVNRMCVRESHPDSLSVDCWWLGGVDCRRISVNWRQERFAFDNEDDTLPQNVFSDTLNLGLGNMEEIQYQNSSDATPQYRYCNNGWWCF